MYALTPLFLYKLQFMAELIVAEALMTCGLRRRRCFALRVVLCAAACYLFRRITILVRKLSAGPNSFV